MEICGDDGNVVKIENHENTKKRSRAFFSAVDAQNIVLGEKAEKSTLSEDVGINCLGFPAGSPIIALTGSTCDQGDDLSYSVSSSQHGSRCYPTVLEIFFPLSMGFDNYTPHFFLWSSPTFRKIMENQFSNSQSC